MSRTFADWLQGQLDSRRLRPIDLARSAGLNHSTISQYLSGRHPRPSVRSAHRIAHGLGLDPEVVFEAGGLLVIEDSPDPESYAAQLHGLVNVIDWEADAGAHFASVRALLQSIAERQARERAARPAATGAGIVSLVS